MVVFCAGSLAVRLYVRSDNENLSNALNWLGALLNCIYGTGIFKLNFDYFD